MSTKTLHKRIALVAVSALGFGVISTAPSSAAEGATAVVTSISLTASTATPGVAATTIITPKVNHGVSAAAGDTITIRGTVLSKPAVSVGTFVTTAGTTIVAVATAAAASKSGVTYATTGASASQFVARAAFAVSDAADMSNSDSNSVTSTTADDDGVGGTPFGSFTFAGDTAGAYTIRVFHDSSANGVADAGETFQDIVITVAASSGVIGNQFPKSDDATVGAVGNLNGVKVSSVSIQTVQASGRTGVFGAFNPRFLLTRNQNGAGNLADAGAANNTKFATMAFTITNPAGTAVAGVGSIGSTTAVALRSVAGSATAIALAATGGAVTQSSAVTHTSVDNQTGGTVFFPMATAGAYTVTLWHDADLDSVIDAGEAIAQSTFQAATDAAPSITITTQGSTIPALGNAAGGIGVLVKICLKNGTLAASLGVNESLTVAGSAGTFIDLTSSMTATGTNTSTGLLKMNVNTDAATASLTAANFNAVGCAYLNMGNGTAGGGVSVVTATIVGGAANGASGSGSFTVRNTTLFPLATTAAQLGNTVVTNPSLSGVLATSNNTATNGAQGVLYTIKTATATTISASLLTGTTKDVVYDALVTDTLGLLTGVIGAQYRLSAASPLTAAAPTATSTTVFSVAVPALAASATNAFTLAINGFDAGGAAVKTVTVTNAAAVATSTYVNVAQSAATYNLRAAVGSKNKFTALVVDQFENPMANVVVSGAITGRNSTTVVAPMVTSATGEVSYELSDVYTSTFLLTDTLTFTPATGTAGTVTVNYATYNAVTKITMTTPDSASATASGVAGTTKSDINAGSKAGPSATLAAVSVILTDVNGATLPAGIPVVFTVDGPGAAILSTTATVNTDATGKAATSVYGWKNGNRTVTATAGGITATGIIYFLQTAAAAGVQTEARTLTATAKDNIVSAKVTDRFDNPIQGIILSASRTGTGSFGGSSSTTGTTDAAGEVQFVLSSGTADVTVAFSSPTFGQTNATKGFLDAGITAFTATTVGTVTTAETGVGASFDAAGVNSVTVKGVTDTAVVDAANASTDAAAEAIDAANAATDAANLAAEAADAATVAAEEARDAADAATAAVEELATQVATLMAALKAQITTLANTVAKIAKKVKA